MWQKNEPQSPPSPAKSVPAASTPGTARNKTWIGPSLVVTGDVSGEENLTVDGQIEGNIRLNQYQVDVAPHGKIRGDIHARTIEVQGQVRGNLFGEEKVTIRPEGEVMGNIQAPRVALEEGCRFKGEVEMGGQVASTAKGS